MDLEKTFTELQAEVRRLEESFEADRQLGRRMNRILLVISVALSGMIITFFLVNYLNLSSKWTQERFRTSLRQEMVELSPAAAHELNLLGRELLPVYAEESRKQLLAMGPEIARELEAQLDELTQELLLSVHRQMQESQEKVLEGSERMLSESFPSLSDAESRERIEKRFREVVENALATSISRFEKRFAKDVDLVRETLLRFDISDTEESTVDLQKKFIHLWLQVLDQEIMEL